MIAKSIVTLNFETRQAMDDALQGKNLHKADSLEELFDDLDE